MVVFMNFSKGSKPALFSTRNWNPSGGRPDLHPPRDDSQLENIHTPGRTGRILTLSTTVFGCRSAPVLGRSEVGSISAPKLAKACLLIDLAAPGDGRTPVAVPRCSPFNQAEPPAPRNWKTSIP